MDLDTAVATVARAALAEIVYLEPSGRIGMAPVTPLLIGNVPCVALPMDRRPLAESLAAAPSVALVLSDSRLALKGWSPLVVTGRAEVTADPTGEIFTTELLEQELSKYPPARRLIDSPLLRRENWWYLPRMVVRVTDVSEAHEVGRREPGRHGLLAWEHAGRLDADTVAVTDWDAASIAVSSAPFSGARFPRGRASAALFSADFSIPDLDRRAELHVTGVLEDGLFTVTERSGSLQLGAPPGVLARLRAQRALERACKAGLEAVESGAHV